MYLQDSHSFDIQRHYTSKFNIFVFSLDSLGWNRSCSLFGNQSLDLAQYSSLPFVEWDDLVEFVT